MSHNARFPSFRSRKRIRWLWWIIRWWKWHPHCLHRDGAYTLGLFNLVGNMSKVFFLFIIFWRTSAFFQSFLSFLFAGQWNQLIHLLREPKHMTPIISLFYCTWPQSSHCSIAHDSFASLFYCTWPQSCHCSMARDPNASLFYCSWPQHLIVLLHMTPSSHCSIAHDPNTSFFYCTWLHHLIVPLHMTPIISLFHCTWLQSSHCSIAHDPSHLIVPLHMTPITHCSMAHDPIILLFYCTWPHHLTVLWHMTP